MKNQDINLAHYVTQRWFQEGRYGVSKYGSLNIPRFWCFLSFNAKIQSSTFKQKNYNPQESVNDLLVRTWNFWKSGINIFYEVWNGDTTLRKTKYKFARFYRRM